ncbi:MAG: hypothetical protein O7H41_02460 [Planctomycetota bacterium]|nr:hypothetical protein [Planctomycetota bacterium]
MKRWTAAERVVALLTSGPILFLAGCAIAPVEITWPAPPEGTPVEGSVRYWIRINNHRAPSLSVESARKEADRLVGGLLATVFEDATPAAGSVRETAALYPDESRKDYAPLAVVSIDVEEVSAALSWGYSVRVGIRIYDIRPWVDRLGSGYWATRQRRIPGLNVEDVSTGWASRSFLTSREDAANLFGDALLSALATTREVLVGNEWLGDFYRLPGERDPIRDGPAIEPLTGSLGSQE